MKKRAVSPVIATVLLIALVTAAAAIVFLVVIPMLRPGATPYFVATPGSSSVNGTHRSISIEIEARGGDLIFDGVTCEQITTLEYSNEGAAIAENAKITVIIKATFEIGTEYTFTFTFTSGDSTFEKTFEHTA
jgi:FlaG/FlaF family flagellin (archaellin)